MRVELPAVLEPRDVRPGLTLGHAQQLDLVSKHVLVAEVRRFDDARASLISRL